MKKSFILLTTILLILLATACDVHAQFATKNCIELGGTVSYSSTTVVTNGTAADQSTSLFQFMPFLNYYVSDGFFLGLSPAIDIVKAAGAADATNIFALFITPGYTFSSRSSVFPYIEGLVGYNSSATGGTSLSGISFGAKGGIKVAVGNNGLASVGVSYMLINLSAKGADKRNGFNNLAITLGFSVFIPR